MGHIPVLGQGARALAGCNGLGTVFLAATMSSKQFHLENQL